MAFEGGRALVPHVWAMAITRERSRRSGKTGSTVKQARRTGGTAKNPRTKKPGTKKSGTKKPDTKKSGTKKSATKTVRASGATNSAAPWDESPPRGTRKTKLSAASKARAKASAKRAGRPYPSLVDNMNAAKKQKRAASKGKAKGRPEGATKAKPTRLRTSQATPKPKGKATGRGTSKATRRPKGDVQ